ncbi:MAG: hypothetical protein O2866_05445 [archaeon]|jgi:hypothetical protein|nr:hypothetical protein [archaeon]MDA1168310.1 hypothetical protein [archaeon]
MENGKSRTSNAAKRPIRNFFKLVPLIEWLYPIDHRRMWKEAFHEAYPTGAALKQSYKAIWEVHTIAAALVLSMNALLFFGLLIGETQDRYWNATPYASIEWWAMMVGGLIVIINFVHLNVLLVVHGVYSAVDDDNFRAIVSAKGPTGRFVMLPEYAIVVSIYGVGVWWAILLFVHVRDPLSVVAILAFLLIVVTGLLAYGAYAARIIYHSGAHKPESIFKETPLADLPQSSEALADLLMLRALSDARATMEPLNITAQIQKDVGMSDTWDTGSGD